MYSSWYNAIRSVELTEDEVKNSHCSCPENPDVNEFGDNSWLPCMSFEPDCDLACKNCIYCTPNEH